MSQYWYKQFLTVFVTLSFLFLLLYIAFLTITELLRSKSFAIALKRLATWLHKDWKNLQVNDLMSLIIWIWQDAKLHEILKGTYLFWEGVPSLTAIMIRLRKMISGIASEQLYMSWSHQDLFINFVNDNLKVFSSLSFFYIETNANKVNTLRI